MKSLSKSLSRPVGRRRALGLAAGAAALTLGAPAILAARTKVQVGLATATWWPSVIAQTAVAQGLFEKAGLEAELTVYRSGGETFEAFAAGAADTITGLPSQIGTARNKGILAKIASLGVSANTGWKLLVPTDSPITTVEEIAGKQVGITRSGSLSDVMALWTRSTYGIDFTSVPVGGGGLVPNLLTGNIDAGVVYSPLSFQTLQAGQARSLLDYATAMPPHLVVGWAFKDDDLAERPELVQGVLQAVYGAVQYLRDNPEAAIATIAEVNSIDVPVAKQEYEETFLKLSTDGTFTMEQVKVGLDLARLAGFTDLAPAEEIVSLDYVPVSPAA